ncbi:MAG: bifunctional serine/threonine-protein kinase/formylglycine-generating enzyme family protein [Clostridium sp.]|nr:bifunctional serine/threonine-protein kinase/formylglycine-generating enzyme family protein [Bacteroides sp.]MCM1198486.1 bifunctional serine/threonine-protein kinase/formylglycine-generating enzyme family protein [Clostridium sp.]
MAVDDNIEFNVLQPGKTLSEGKYVIEAKIGEGGFGVTYKAVQSGLDRIVCIKEYFLAGKCGRQSDGSTVYVSSNAEITFEKYRKSFVKEARLLASLHHQGIVEVLDVFDENNTSYMVMAFVKGKSLQEIVSGQGVLPYTEAINYMAQVANAVGYIHERHILHRDIKPDNIMITPDFKAVLIDFGSAREFEQDKTQAQTSILTHGYAPVEQYSKNSRKGAYTDIYAIGATMYFIITGQVPVDAAARSIERLPPPVELVPDIPEEVNRTIQKAMQLKSENRHQNIQEFMDDLLNVRPSVLVDETIGGTKKEDVINKTESQPSAGKKRIFVTAVASAVAIVLCSSIVMSLLRGGGNQYPVKDFTGMNVYPMVKVKGGSFVMGNNNMDEEDCPEHLVTLDDFYIGQFEVTQGLWKMIMGSNPSRYRPDGGIDSLPVENVSYADIMDFIDGLNRATGLNFSLPTEAQWEYAARGGIQSKGFVFAGTSDPGRIWFDRQYPSKVMFRPSVNELGIYQMSGNVAELCQDYYDMDFYNVCNMKNPVNTAVSPSHVIRGGSFSDSDAEYVNVFYRDADNAARQDVGFRLVLNKR